MLDVLKYIRKIRPSRAFGNVRYQTFTEKSYITFNNDANKKWSLVAECNSDLLLYSYLTLCLESTCLHEWFECR